MLCVRIVAVSLLLFSQQMAFAGEAEDLLARLKNVDAKNAVKDYEEAIAKSQEDFTLRVGAAKKKLLAVLELVQANVAKENDLDEAVLIRDVKRLYKASAEPAPLMTDIHVIAAFYGQNISWLDVTEKAREAIKGKTKWSTTVDTKDWGEPAPGFGGPRTLMIRYSVDGEVKYKAAYQGHALSIP